MSKVTVTPANISKGGQNSDYDGISPRPNPPQGSMPRIDEEIAAAKNIEYIRFHKDGYQIFDGEILKRRLERFLQQVDNALSINQELTHFEISSISVSVSLDAGLNVGFAGIVGIDASRSRSFEFTLKRK